MTDHNDHLYLVSTSPIRDLAQDVREIDAHIAAQKEARDNFVPEALAIYVDEALYQDIHWENGASSLRIKANAGLATIVGTNAAGERMELGTYMFSYNDENRSEDHVMRIPNVGMIHGRLTYHEDNSVDLDLRLIEYGKKLTVLPVFGDSRSVAPPQENSEGPSKPKPARGRRPGHNL